MEGTRRQTESCPASTMNTLSPFLVLLAVVAASGSILDFEAPGQCPVIAKSKLRIDQTIDFKQVSFWCSEVKSIDHCVFFRAKLLTYAIYKITIWDELKKITYNKHDYFL